MSSITITHDNGVFVCLSDGTVYDRMNRELTGPSGTVIPVLGEIIAALIREAEDRAVEFTIARLIPDPA